MIKYPIGIQTFENIIDGNYIYVDKTDLVFSIADKYTYVFLSRPRRFGKSLLISTFESYFKGDKDLFKGLAIEGLEKEWFEYPVFRFDFSGNNFNHPDRLIGHINGYLEDFEKTYGLCTEECNVFERLLTLIEEVYRKLNKKVVILIDEYDWPLLYTLHLPELHEKIKNELSGFYAAIKASGEYIRFAMVTGITSFEKLSFSNGMNGFKDISLIPRYNSICGISETEFHSLFTDSIISFANENNIQEEQVWHDFRDMYAGYHFASRGEEIYNPNSVINAFDENELKNFWFASGISSYLKSLIKRNPHCLDSFGSLRFTEAQLNYYSVYSYAVSPLLYQAGYLTIKDYDIETQEYTLDFPNREVLCVFEASLTPEQLMAGS